MAVTITSQSGRAEVSSPKWYVETTSTLESVVIGSNAQTVTSRSGSYGIEVETGVLIGGVPYTGEYEAKSLFSEQVFPTALKTMREDFSVHAINYTEAPNDYGKTLTIGG